MSSDLHRVIAGIEPSEGLLVALDFDGTLSHLVSEPSQARPVPGVLESLADLARAPLTDVVIVSGRGLHDLAMVSGAAEIATLIGSHGQEQGSPVSLDDTEATLLKALQKSITKDVAAVQGVRVEEKPAGLAIHVRNSSRPDAEMVLAGVRNLAEAIPGTHLIEGKEVIEVSVRPLDKGSALVALMEVDPHRRVLFAGDDVTDEAAMAVLRPRDISIKVGEGPTVATYRIPDPTQMVAVLAEVARVRGIGGQPNANELGHLPED